MRKIIIDTNFWLLPFERGIDFVSQIERMCDDEPYLLVVPKPVLDELKMMAGEEVKKKNTRAAKGALVAIEWLKKNNQLEIADITGQADGAIITLSLRLHAWVATNDRKLRDRLAVKGIKNLVLKDGHKVDLA